MISPPPVPDAAADAATTWYAALQQSDPAEANRVFWQAIELVRDVTGVPRETVADVLGTPEGSPARARFDRWFCYGLHLIRTGLHQPPAPHLATP